MTGLDKRFLKEVPATSVPSRDDAREIVSRNLETIRKSELFRRKEGIFSYEKPESLFTFDGAIKMRRVTHPAYREFFEYPGRMVRERGGYVLRGQRYLCTLDPNIAFPHKIKILTQDFSAALDALLKDNHPNGGKEHFPLRFAAMDYVKNSAITFLNALVSPEKFGYFNLDNQDYQHARTSAVRLAGLATRAQYAYMLGDEAEARSSLALLDAARSEMERVTAQLEESVRNTIENGDAFVRPVLARSELAHPLLIGAAALTTLERRKDNPPDTLLAIPTGGTEYGYVLQYALMRLRGILTPLVLAPVSVHMTRMNAQLEREEDVITAAADVASGARRGELGQFLQRHASAFQGNSVLIIDDNSASGKTLQLVADTLTFMFGPRELDTSVAETDVVRMELRRQKLADKAEGADPYPVSSETAVQDAVGILPVSQELQSNTDLRKLMEFRRVWRFYEQQKGITNTLADTVVRKVISRTMTYTPLGQFLQDPLRSEGIFSFSDSFLSNFERVNIEYTIPGTNGRGHRRRQKVTYPSVEHAYQAAKFPLEIARKIPAEVFAQVNTFMRERYARADSSRWTPIQTPEELVAAFANPSYSAGQMKWFSDKLRDAGYIRDDWFDIRLSVMVDLLLEKFKDPVLKEKLLATGNKFLAEGNTWGDTYWGVAMKSTKGMVMGPNVMKQGYGSNMLGSVLMEIRAQLRDSEG